MTESLPDDSAPAAAEPMFFLLTCTIDSCLSGLSLAICLSGLVFLLGTSKTLRLSREITP